VLDYDFSLTYQLRLLVPINEAMTGPNSGPLKPTNAYKLNA
jgi:hypothetical protein